MNEKTLKRKTTKDDFYSDYLKTMNGHLALTNRELEVLVELCKLQALTLDKDYSPEQLSKQILGSISRKEIRTKLGISPFNLNNIIKILKDKSIIKDTNGKYSIHPMFFVPDTDNEYAINFKLEVHESR